MYNGMLVSIKGNRATFSNVQAPDTHVAANALDFPAKLMTLAVMGNTCMLFTRDKIYPVMGNQPNDIKSINRGDTPGTDSPRSLVRIGDYVYYWSGDRIYRYNGALVEEVAYPKLRLTAGSIVKTVSSQFAGATLNNKYYLAITYSTGTANNAVLVYDPRFDEYVLHSAPWVYSFHTTRATADSPKTLIFCTNSAASRIEKLYIYNGTTTPADTTTGTTTVAITFKYSTTNLDHGDSHLIKKNKYLFFNTKALGPTAILSIKASPDYGTFGTVLDVAMSAPGFVLDTNKLDIDKLVDTNYSLTDVKRLTLPASRTIAIQFTDTHAIGRTEIYDFDLQIIPKKLKTK
jgi:hypothetical protein